MDIAFPFTPKSNTKLEPGHFWPVRLKNGNFGCGVVLDIPNDRKSQGNRSCYIGLLNWTNSIKPSVQTLEAMPLTILKQGHAHIKTISVQGEQIIGVIDLKKNNLSVDLVVDSQNYSNSSYVLKGFQTVRKATREDHETLGTKSTWGYEVILKLANQLLTN